MVILCIINPGLEISIQVYHLVRGPTCGSNLIHFSCWNLKSSQKSVIYSISPFMSAWNFLRNSEILYTFSCDDRLTSSMHCNGKFQRNFWFLQEHWSTTLCFYTTHLPFLFSGPSFIPLSILNAPLSIRDVRPWIASLRSFL